MQTARPISTKFCADLHTNARKVLNTSMTRPTQTPDPKLQNQNRIAEKKLCFTKKHIQFFPGSPGPRLASSRVKNESQYMFGRTKLTWFFFILSLSLYEEDTPK